MPEMQVSLKMVNIKEDFVTQFWLGIEAVI